MASENPHKKDAAPALGDALAIAKTRQGVNQRANDRANANAVAQAAALALSASRPQRVLPAERSWPLHSVAASRALEARLKACLAPGVLMQAAGLSVARWALALAPHAQRIAVFAGPGGNGGDGLYAAAHLQRWGRQIDVHLMADEQRLGPESQAALAAARAAGVAVHAGLFDSRLLTAPDLALDALVGIGAIQRPPGPIDQAIKAFNALPCLRLAVDLPSGLNANSGHIAGLAVQAHATLALLSLKPGLFTGQGRDACGGIWFDGLGASAVHGPEAACAQLLGASDAQLPARQHQQHKGSFGDVLVIGGAPGMVGAAHLAGHAALAAGAGRVWMSLLDEAAPASDARRPEWLWRAAAWRHATQRLSEATVVCGCGGGDRVSKALPSVLALAPRLVLDADALNALAIEPKLAAAMRARPGRNQTTVMTPHPLEAARLLACSTAEVQADRLGAAQALAERWQAVVVLKGSGTVIAAPGQRPHINSSGSAALASAGTGDVLAGWLGGLWAQQAAQTHSAVSSALAAALTAVWRHGAAAQACAAPSVRALDLVEALRALP